MFCIPPKHVSERFSPSRSIHVLIFRWPCCLPHICTVLPSLLIEILCVKWTDFPWFLSFLVCFDVFSTPGLCATKFFTFVIHPSRHCGIRLFIRKSARGRCHSQQLLSSDQCAPHHSWRKAPPYLGAQRRGLPPSRDRHDASDHVVNGDGHEIYHIHAAGAPFPLRDPVLSSPLRRQVAPDTSSTVSSPSFGLHLVWLFGSSTMFGGLFIFLHQAHDSSKRRAGASSPSTECDCSSQFPSKILHELSAMTSDKDGPWCCPKESSPMLLFLCNHRPTSLVFVSSEAKYHLGHS